jgi:hypothetical protein
MKNPDHPTPPTPELPRVHIYARPHYNKQGRLLGTAHPLGRPIVRLDNGETITLPSSADYELVTP